MLDVAFDELARGGPQKLLARQIAGAATASAIPS